MRAILLVPFAILLARVFNFILIPPNDSNKPKSDYIDDYTLSFSLELIGETDSRTNRSLLFITFPNGSTLNEVIDAKLNFYKQDLEEGKLETEILFSLPLDEEKIVNDLDMSEEFENKVQKDGIEIGEEDIGVGEEYKHQRISKEDHDVPRTQKTYIAYIELNEAESASRIIISNTPKHHDKMLKELRNTICTINDLRVDLIKIISLNILIDLPWVNNYNTSDSIFPKEILITIHSLLRSINTFEGKISGEMKRLDPVDDEEATWHIVIKEPKIDFIINCFPEEITFNEAPPSERRSLLEDPATLPNCTVGQVYNENKTACVRCEPGTYAVHVSLPCRGCRAGTYSAGGQNSCISCEVGYYNPDVNQSSPSSCKPCPVGNKCPSQETTIPTECSPGTFANKIASSSCTLCLGGSYSGKPGAVTCDICPAAYYSGSGATYCSDCTAGTANPSRNQSSCPQCKPGYYNPNTTQTSCTPCPAGTYNIKTGSYYEIDCIDCDPGSISALASYQCEDCETGTYGSENRTSCIPCPEGTYNNETKMASGDACLPCPIMHYNNLTGRPECPHCPEETYTDDVGKTFCSNCNRLCRVCYGRTNNDCTECKEKVVYLDTIKGSRCACISGYFDDPDQKKEADYCQPCHEFCRDCYLTANNCLNCIYNKGIRMVDNQCLCINPGYFIHPNPITEKQECLRCFPLCTSCSGIRADQCGSCSEEAGAIFIEPSTCACPSGYYYNSTFENCEKCSGLCTKCFGPSSQQCDECKESVAIPVIDQPTWCTTDCELLGNYYRDTDYCKRKLLLIE